MNPEKFQAYAEKIINNCGRVIVGKDEVIRQVIVSFLCGGHVLLLRTYRRGARYNGSPETVTTLEAENSGRRDPRRSNRGKVRHYYREFLKMERKRGMKLRKDYTTADILQRISEDTDPEGARELRSIYLPARYDERNDITPEQAEAAKLALRRSRGGQKQKA